MDDKITRRKALRLGAATASLGAVGSLSGCSAVQDLIPGGGGLGAYTDWVYEPDTFQSDQESLGVSATGYQSIAGNGNVDEDTRESIITRNYPDLGISATNVSMELSLPQGRVMTGSFDAETVKGELTADQLSTPTDSLGNGPIGSTVYESDGESGDYEIFIQSEPDNSPNAYAVSGGTIIEAGRVSNDSNESDPVDATDVAEGIIETGTEGSGRLVDSDDNFSTLTDTLNSGVSLGATLYDNAIGSEDGRDANVSAGNFEGVVATGASSSLNGDTTEYQLVFVYDSEGDVDEGDIEDWVDANDTGSDGALGNYRNISINTDANTATVTATIDTAAWSLNGN